jgi:hypothetical protein
MAHGQKLGASQIGCLRALCKIGQWPGGWLWNCESGTIKILDSLVRRGFATRQEPDGLRTVAWHLPRFYPTESGRAYLDELKAREECHNR